MSEPGSSSQPDSTDVTRLLSEAAAGHRSAAEALFPVVYEELRALAGAYFRRQPASHTLQPTALVHEAFLRLVGPTSTAAKDRGHFFALAATVMRQVLVHHARQKSAEKRGGAWTRITLDQTVTPVPSRELDLVAVDDALRRLAELNPRQASLVEMRFFGGLSVEDAAEVLHVARSTASDDWRFARAWLMTELGDGG